MADEIDPGAGHGGTHPATSNGTDSRLKHERIDYRTGILSSPAEVPADEWNALLARDAQPTPFLRHEFLDALHVARCAVDDTGWSPHFVTLTDAGTGRLVAAAPVYAKQHSYGEYVFDWAWADAYQRNDLPYYPKLLCAVPFTPVQGTRLLAADDDARRRLAATLLAFAEQSDVSSLHVLFPTGDEARLLESMGMMLREGVQFHWINDGYRHFDDFLATLEQKKRKNIRAERRKVHDAGVTFRRLTGDRITDADWRFFSRCYRQTYREHYSSPYLNLEFFRTIGATMPENLLLVIAEADGKPIASALAVYRRGEHGGGTLYGRYWGALEHVPCLHFETAYYQLLEFCIEAGLDTFEGGAQGEHKLARGFLPTVTHSAHWLAHPAFSDAVARFLERETEHIHAYVDELREHDPFRRGTE
ncbi:hypothetical protein BSFP_012160 [Burkholderia stabilis]|uniref:N-acetyltransferase n=1 Tax=Burkholderia stabilis TaxID=95485 RepID=A0A1Y1BEN2_9BURK|nr:hypothetical protein BSFP_012160 [Burkholderia stabilis]